MNLFMPLGLNRTLGFEVPVKGLPIAASQLRMGGVYLIQVDLRLALSPLINGIFSTLGMASEAASRRVCIIGPSLTPFPIDLRQTGQDLRVFDIDQWQRLGSSSGAIPELLRELEDTPLPPQSLIILLDKDSSLLQDDRLRARLTQALVPWSKAWGHCLIWIAGPCKTLELASSSLSPFQGTARLTQEGRMTYWAIHHWSGPAGDRVTDTTLGIRTAADSVPFETIGLSIQNNDGLYLRAPDETRVIIDATVAAFDPSHPQSWEVIRDPSALDDALEGAMAPTLVLGYGPDTHFEDLAHLIENLRQGVGRGIKLVLRETQFRIRNYQERLLYFLGLNAIVHPSERTQELLETIDSLQGFAFTPPKINVPIEQLLFAVMPPREKGYLPPQEFIGRLRNNLHPENPFDVRHALIQLDLLPGVTQLTAIEAFRANRPGDLITAGFDEIYLFLFGCSPADIPIALSHCFLESLPHYFSSDHQWIDTLMIIEKLTELQETWERELPPDFSLNLGSQPERSAEP